MASIRWMAVVVFSAAMALMVASRGAAQDHALENAAAEAEHAVDPHPADGSAEVDPHHGEHEAHGSPDPMSIDPDLALWTAGVFVLLLAVLRKFAWGPIVTALDDRERNMADQLAAAEAAQANATKLLAEYEKKLAVASEQVNVMIEKGRREAELQAQRIVDDATEVARAEKSRAVAAIQAAKEEALRELADKSVDTAFGLAGKVLGREIRPAEHTALVREAISQFPGKQGA